MDETLQKAYDLVLKGRRVEVYDASGSEAKRITLWSEKVDGRAKLFWKRMLTSYKERSYARFAWLVREFAEIRDARYREV